MKRLLAIVLVMCAMAPVNIHAAAGIQCDFFDYQSDAQHTLDRTLKDYPDLGTEGLDNDGDGIACNEMPERPRSIAKAQMLRGNFEPALDYVGIHGPAYSAWYNVRLAGIQLASEHGAPKGIACPGLVTNQVIADLINPADGTARNYYGLSSTKTPLPPGDVTDDTYDVTASMWTVVDDPAAPVMVNEWLIRQGIAVLDDGTISGKTQTNLEDAQASSQADGLGVWGDCTLPDAFAPTAVASAPAGQVLQRSGTGTQIVPFEVSTGATYLLTINAGGLTFVDAYLTSGEQIYGLSISTGDPGIFTSAEYLAPGSYYLEITSNYGWTVSIAELGS